MRCCFPEPSSLNEATQSSAQVLGKNRILLHTVFQCSLSKTQLQSRAWALGKFAFPCEIHHNILMHFSSFPPGSTARANHSKSVIALLSSYPSLQDFLSSIFNCQDVSIIIFLQPAPSNSRHSRPDPFQHLSSSPHTPTICPHSNQANLLCPSCSVVSHLPPFCCRHCPNQPPSSQPTVSSK